MWNDTIVTLLQWIFSILMFCFCYKNGYSHVLDRFMILQQSLYFWYIYKGYNDHIRLIDIRTDIGCSLFFYHLCTIICYWLKTFQQYSYSIITVLEYLRTKLIHLHHIARRKCPTIINCFFILVLAIFCMTYSYIFFSCSMASRNKR